MVENTPSEIHYGGNKIPYGGARLQFVNTRVERHRKVIDSLDLRGLQSRSQSPSLCESTVLPGGVGVDIWIPESELEPKSLKFHRLRNTGWVLFTERLE